MNICSLTKNFDDFNILLHEINVNFDILAIKSSINLHLDNYSTERTPTKSSAGGTLLSLLITWLSLLHNFIQQSLNSNAPQVQILPAACQRSAMVRISENGPGWK